MQKLNLIIFGLLFCLLVSVNSLHTAKIKPIRPITLAIIGTNDIHGTAFPK